MSQHVGIQMTCSTQGIMKHITENNNLWQDVSLTIKNTKQNAHGVQGKGERGRKGKREKK